MKLHIPTLFLSSVSIPALSLGQMALHAPTTLDTYTGDAAGAHFRHAVPLGDVDGDGVPDLVVSAPLDDGAGTDAGTVMAVSGIDGSALWSVDGSAGAQLGNALVLIDDWDGDGLRDLAVGAPATGSTTASGAVQIHSSADGSLLLTIPGTQAGEAFGFALDDLADRDADGLRDLVVGAPGYDDGNAADTGRVLVISTGDGEVLHSAVGDAAGDELGWSVSASLPPGVVGSHDPDIVVGAPVGGGSDEGVVQWRSADDFSLLRETTGTATDDRFGTSVAHIGDGDGDGQPDLIFGATPVDSAGALAGAGYVVIHAADDGALIDSLTGGMASAYGASISILGDITGDGVPEIVVGEPLADDNGSDSGRIEIRDGADRSLLHAMSGSAGSRFGDGLALFPDRDDDGLPDLCVAAPLDDLGGTDEGAFRVLSFSRFTNAATGVAGTHGIPQLAAQGTLAAGTILGAELRSATESATAVLVWGHSLVLDATLQTWVPQVVSSEPGLSTDAVGELDHDVTWPAGFAAGTTVYFQYQVVDAAAPGGVALSNVVSGLTQ